MKKTVYFLCVFCILNMTTKGQLVSPDQNLPDSIPHIFAKGIVSTQYAEFGITVSPDNSEIYFTRRGSNINPRLGEIIVIKNNNGKWTEPKVASFSGHYNDMEPLITPDGKSLIFGSNRPIHENETARQFNQWYIEKTNNKWSEPQIFEPLQNKGFVMYPTMANNGNIYYTSQDGIYMIKYIEGTYSSPLKLTDKINNLPRAAHPFISPDESFLIFDAQPRGEMKSDLFITYNNKGEWTEPLKLNANINASESNAIAFITYDKNYMFFVRNGEIYWLKTELIMNLKKNEK